MKSATVWQAGYTIVEVMIFLIISGVLLMGAFGLFNGHIQRTQFTQAVQEISARIQNTTNEVSTGTFPDNPAFNCTVVPGNAPVIAAGASGQGTRSGCIFVGKVINLAVSASGCADPISTAPNCGKADVYTAVGRRTTNGTTAVTVLDGPTGALPRLVAGAPVDITQTYAYGNGVHVTGVYQETNPLTPISGIGLFQSFGGSYAGANLTSGSQNVQLWIVKSSTAPANPQTAANEKTNLATNSIATPTLIGPNPTPGILICLAGGTSQKAAIRIDPATNGMTTKTTVDDPKC